MPVCLEAQGSRGYWQSSSLPCLQRAQVISMLSLPFETWFSYSLSAKVTRLGETASRLARRKATSKLFLEFLSLARSHSLSRSIFLRGGWYLLCACVGCSGMGVTHTEGGRVGAVTITARRNGDFLKTWKDGLSKRISLPRSSGLVFSDKRPTWGSKRIRKEEIMSNKAR